MTRTGTLKSGWCIAPAGMAAHHTSCKAAVCSCECHTDRNVPADRKVRP